MTELADPIRGRDRELIVAQAERQGMHELRRPPRTPIAVGDGETSYELDCEGDGVVYVETQRGHRVPQLVFTNVDDAVRFLVFLLSGRLSVPSPGFAPGAAYDADGEDRVLTWRGGRAVSPGGRLDPGRAREFSWVATTDPADIAARRVPILRVADRHDDLDPRSG